ncbi:ATP-dependent DNA helicase DinG [Lentibacillus amyloliquefaciens]|uniref:3'-5' exonuclease DinG n=1 Tax=Lentibacillus amyloliquefaciens TaxID=1472767 RepID=A0A0U4F581_9BACI|nr:ATP-dependent DNA helicase DinG [Lentibacillus amyloliquefaciens]ALX47939.1 DNA polymerase III subunit epsilon [Lentibacillus amyloliquefaciens]
MNEKYVVVDLETTGHSPANSDKIIEVGIVIIENNEITGEHSTFLNPEKPIPAFITNLTGISDQDVNGAPRFHDKASDITALFENSYLVAHNVPFDLGFLNGELASAGFPKLENPVLDTVELARILYPQAPGFKLGQLADHLNITHDAPHRALTDALMTAELLLILLKKLRKLPYETITHLLNLQQGLQSDLYALLNEQQHSLAFSSDSDKTMDIYRGMAIKKVSEEKSETQYVESSFGSYLDAIYETGGTLEQEMSRYEKRSGQREMSETVFDAFRSGNHALIEAETGTGKTLAYLLPAIYEAATMNKKVVISTYTTQLQSQLLDEEVPLINKLVDFGFNIALLKGKQHYLSLEKFERELGTNQEVNYDLTLTKAMILVWLTETETGDVDEIQLPSSGYIFYRQVSTDAESGFDPSSPWFSRSFYQKARQKAQKADILITNHALLSTDMFNDYQLLPAYDKAIIDEAHHLEETASKHYGLTLNYVYIQNTLNQIGSINDDNWLAKLLKEQKISHDDGFRESEWEHIFENAKHEIDDLFRMLFQYVIEQKQKSKTLSDIGRIQYRFEETKEHVEEWGVIKDMVTRLTFYFRDLIHLLSSLKQELKTNSPDDNHYADETNSHMEAIQSIIDRLEQLFLFDDDNTVKWIEIEAYGAKNAVYLYSEPTDISTLLANDFFEKKESIILTSATLSIRNSFLFSQKRLGLSPENLITAKINSPFSYQDQVQLMVPDDFPDVRFGKQDDFIHSTCEAIISLARITDGRMLVLFTSYDMLKKSYYLLKETIDINKYMLIAQGISSGSRSRLKKNFQTFDQSILLGTSSFWEGVDIPGEDLSCLMIVRLPFQPPNHPVYEAKSNELKREGRNAFFELSLPNAVIRFKQGFGRLIRSATDRGIVFVCDARVIKARYGKYFTESIPSAPITTDSTHALMEKAEEWF